MNILSNYERGFIAACIDTDGYITLSKRSGTGCSRIVGVGFANNSILFLNRIQYILGTNKKLINKKGTNNYKFRLSPSESYDLLKQISLIIKEHRRIIAIELYELGRSAFGMNKHSPRLEEHVKKTETLIKKFYSK